MHNSERLVVITGGTKGIGKALVDRFASEGWPVATCSRKDDDLDALRKEISEKHQTLIHTFKADLSKKEGVKDFVEFVQMIAKPVEILVNNTGVFNPGSVLEEADGALEQMIDTNLYSAYHLTRAIAPAMKQNKSGHIFNLCSVASLKAYPNGGSYSISKFA
ncbi:MAG: SDR family oxidoreductase, partial [Ekhidna sp.]